MNFLLPLLTHKLSTDVRPDFNSSTVFGSCARAPTRLNSEDQREGAALINHSVRHVTVGPLHNPRVTREGKSNVGSC